MYSLTMQQLTGANPITVTLSGPALPEKELPERHKLKHVKTHYPGGLHPTVQVLYSEAAAFRFSGLLSDKEARQVGFADAIRNGLRRLHRDQRLIRFSYRSLEFDGFITDVQFFEEDQWECRYEVEFDPARWAPEQPFVSVEIREPLDMGRMEEVLIRLESLVEEEIAAGPAIPAEIAEFIFGEGIPIPQTIKTEIDYDPYLSFMLNYWEMRRHIRKLLYLAGNAKVLDVTATVETTGFAVLRAANIARTSLASYSGTDGSLIGRVNQFSRLTEIGSSVDTVRMLF